MSERGRALVEKLAGLEGGRSEMFAACVPGKQVRARVQGLVRTWKVKPEDTDGFCIVHPLDDATVSRIDVARPTQIERYLELLPAVRMILVRPDHSGGKRCWLAVPFNFSDVKQRFAWSAAARRVYFVEGASPFDVVIARNDGHLLFHEVDRAADAKIADGLRDAFVQRRLPDELSVAGAGPEHLAAYALALAPFEEDLRVARTRVEIESQVARGGGALVSFEDEGELMRVTFRGRSGSEHIVYVEKRDLTVSSAGICLSGQDRDFDLASIVGVIDDS